MIRLSQVAVGAIGVHTMRLKAEEAGLDVRTINISAGDDFGRFHCDRPTLDVEGDLQTARDLCTPLGWFADELRC